MTFGSHALPAKPNSQTGISVIIPAFRAERSIARAVESALNQTLKPDEIIVVVDGDDDRTVDILQAIGGRPGGEIIRTIVQIHAGAGAARNRALHEARGSVVAFLDADDEWLPKKLEASLEHLPGKVLVAHNYLRAQSGRPSVVVDCVQRFASGRDPFVALYLRGYLATSTVVALRDKVIDAGGFDPTLTNAQDFDLWLRLLGPPEAEFIVFDDPLTLYHFGEGGLTGNTDRRIECCRHVALQRAPLLRGHAKIPFLAVLLRMLAIHYEAVAAHLRNGRFLRAAATLFGLLPSLVAAVPAVLVPARTKHCWMPIFLYVWVLSIIVLYLVQFQDPILSILNSFT